ncbi:MAG: hypothetical protein RI950_1338 [Bacteroidota bacterium]
MQKGNIMHRKNIIETLKLRRITLQTTQETLSILSGVSLRTVKQFESGKGNPTLETLQKIADVLGLELKLEIKTIFTEDEKSNDSI